MKVESTELYDQQKQHILGEQKNILQNYNWKKRKIHYRPEVLLNWG